MPLSVRNQDSSGQDRKGQDRTVGGPCGECEELVYPPNQEMSAVQMRATGKNKTESHCPAFVLEIPFCVNLGVF